MRKNANLTFEGQLTLLGSALGLTVHTAGGRHNVTPEAWVTPALDLIIQR